MKKKSTFSWVLEFAGRRIKYFGWSVVLAVIGVALSFGPYLIMSDMVVQLLNGNKDWNYYFSKILLMAACWVLRLLCHSISTSLSHMGTFNVLGTVRRQLCEKLSKIPLGSVLSDNSGTYKNIIVERVDSMETTLAHIIPEFSANILLPIVIFVYLISLDWRMGLANLISVVIGGILCAGMFVKSGNGYEVSVQKTKALNDTAVEYINGIEVIKAFGKSKTSYDKFVTAAREGADCFIDWMRRCIWWQTGFMAFMPATFLGVLPVGLLLIKNGSLTPENFVMSVILSAGLITPLIVAFSYTDDLLKIKTIFGEVTEILERDDMKRPETLAKEPVGSDITLSNVKFKYKDAEVLHGINMEIKQGEVSAIVGPHSAALTSRIFLWITT